MPEDLNYQRFHFPLAPTPKARPRIANGHAFTPNKTRFAEEALREMMKADGALLYPHRQSLNVRLTFYVVRPKSTAKELAFPHVRPDLDQYVKLVLDAGNGVLWFDDAQVVQLLAAKVYATEGGIELEVSPATAPWRGSHGHDVVGAMPEPLPALR